jgi:polar amino acid transport system substrate-binding protein
MMAHTKRAFLTFAALAVMSGASLAADMIGNCEVTGKKGSIPLAAPAVAGQLTAPVMTSL